MKNEFSANSQNCRKQLKLWFDIAHDELLSEREVYERYMKYLSEVFEANGIDEAFDNASFIEWYQENDLCDVINTDEFLSKPHDSSLWFSTESRDIVDFYELIKLFSETISSACDPFSYTLQEFTDDCYCHEVANWTEILKRIKEGEFK